MKKLTLLALILTCAPFTTSVQAFDFDDSSFTDEIQAHIVQASEYSGMDQVRALDRVLQRVERSGLPTEEKVALYERVAQKLHSVSRSVRSELEGAQAEELDWILKRTTETEFSLSMKSGQTSGVQQQREFQPKEQGFWRKHFSKVIAAATVVVLAGGALYYKKKKKDGKPSSGSGAISLSSAGDPGGVSGGTPQDPAKQAQHAAMVDLEESPTWTQSFEILRYGGSYDVPLLLETDESIRGVYKGIMEILGDSLWHRLERKPDLSKLTKDQLVQLGDLFDELHAFLLPLKPLHDDWSAAKKERLEQLFEGFDNRDELVRMYAGRNILPGFAGYYRSEGETPASRLIEARKQMQKDTNQLLLELMVPLAQKVFADTREFADDNLRFLHIDGKAAADDGGHFARFAEFIAPWFSGDAQAAKEKLVEYLKR